MSGLAFESPAWLWGLVLIAPAAWIAARSFSTMSMLRRVVAACARAVLIALVVFVLAGAASVRTNDDLAVVLVVDVSQSVQRFGVVDTDQGDAPASDVLPRLVERAARVRGEHDLLGVVTFDGQSLVVAVPTRGELAGRTLDVSGNPGTDIEGALRVAAGLIPPDAAGRIVLLSDGNETRGDAARAARSLAAVGDGVRLDALPLGLWTGPEVIVERAAGPPSGRPGSVVDLRVTLRATSPARGVLRVSDNGQPLEVNGGGASAPVAVPAGRSVHVLRVTLPPGRIHRFEAVFEPETDGVGEPVGDGVLANNRASAVTISDDEGSVLFVTTRTGPRRIARALPGFGSRVEVVGPAAMPTSLLDLERYDLVVLENVPVEGADERTWASLAAFVQRGGGGLVMIGGPDSFGAGGWVGSPLEALLPVELEVPDRVLMPEAAVVFVLDSSGSMGRRVFGSARTQQQIANESAAQAIGVLAENDLVGVIQFDSRSRVVWKLSPNDDPDAAKSAVRSIAAGGGTVMGPAMRLAVEELSGVDAKLKHVILLSDGQSEDAVSLAAIAQQMASADIKLTCIAVGDDADGQTLRELATIADGAFYDVSDPEVLPRIFLKAVRVVREPLLRDEPFEPVDLRSASPVLLGVGAPPQLGGLTLTSPREGLGVVDVLATPDGYPVLAHWPAGLGQVAAFTSDADRWGAAWSEWPGFERFWRSLASAVSRPPGDARLEVSLAVEDGVARVRLDANADDGTPMIDLNAPATLYGPAGEPIDLTLVQVEPGVYQADRSLEGDAGVFVAVVRPSAGGTALRPAVAGAAVSDEREFRELDADLLRMGELATITGGRVLSANDFGPGLFDRAGIEPRRAMTPLAPLLLAWAVVALLVDVGVRRIAWDRALSSRFGEGWVGSARRAVAVATPQSAGTLAERLQRAHETPTPASEVDERQSARERLQRRLEAERAKQRDEKGEPMPDATAGDQASGTKPRASEQKQSDEAEAGGSGLMAAKRRARERFEE